MVEVGTLLRGRAEVARETTVLGVSILAGEQHRLSEAELAFLLGLPPERWVEPGEGVDGGSLADRGLVVSDGEAERLADLRRRDEALTRARWNVYAALFHFLTRWSGVDMRPGAEVGEPVDLPPIDRELVDEFIAVFGAPPEAFFSASKTDDVLELPRPDREGGLFALLPRRHTTRSFDRTTPMTLDQLSTVLYHVWGCSGVAEMTPGHVILKKTSPSGGGLHPLESFPLVTNVDGLAPGFYHYDVRRHALASIAPLDAADACEVATSLLAGQQYFGAAHVCVFMAARFDRMHWKYRRHQKALAAVLMDAGHLSQTLYLVAAELGLGAFVTAALNSADVDRRLGLDGIELGVVAVAGCGPRTEEASVWEPRFTPYSPPGAR